MRYLLPLLLLPLAVVLSPSAALCQSRASPLARADITASVGSFSAKRDEAHEYDDWSHSLYGGIAGGVYWTDHLKTELDVASSSRAQLYSSEPADVSGSPLSSIFLTHEYHSLNVSLGQTYQFGRNALFHPFVAGGIDIEHRRHEIERPAQSVTVYGRNPLNQQIVQSIGQIPIPALTRTETAITVSPYAAAGLKAYFTERGFFRTDLKVSFRNGFDRVAWRTGFGVDF